jgi:enoyl-CoA hydratase
MSAVGVTWERGYVILEIQREAALNALNREVLQDLWDTLRTAEARDDIRAVVVTGAGQRAFAAGADIREIHALSYAHDGEAFARFGQEVFNAIAESRLISVAAVNGYALGGGLELALAADFRIVADTAVVGLPEITLGIIPGFGGTQRLARLVGEARALDLILTGRRIDAATALSWGLAHQVVPGDQVKAAAEALCQELRDRAPLALALAKKAVRQGSGMPLVHGLALERTQFGLTVASADAHEGTAAFLERRPPRFTGR